jgi:hypothetical protein
MKTIQTVVSVLVLCCAAMLGALAQSTMQAPSKCVAQLDGGQFPFLLPEYHMWEAVFTAAANKPGPIADMDLSLSDAGGRAMQSIGSIALARAAAIRAGIPGRDGRSP